MKNMKFEHKPPAEINVPNTNIHLRLFCHGDEGNLMRLTIDEPVQIFVPWAKRIMDEASAGKMIDEFQRTWKDDLVVRYAIEQDGEFVGYAGVWPDKKPDYYEFGFAVLPEFRRQGIGSKTTAELFTVAKEQLGAKGIVAYVNDDNLASQEVVIGHGFQRLDEFDSGDRRYELEFQ